MSANFSSWEEVKAKAAAIDPRSADERAEAQTAAAERRDAYVRGYQSPRCARPPG